MPDELDKVLPRWCTELLEMDEKARQERDSKLYKILSSPPSQRR